MVEEEVSTNEYTKAQKKKKRLSTIRKCRRKLNLFFEKTHQPILLNGLITNHN